MVVLSIAIWPPFFTIYVTGLWAVKDWFRILNYVISLFLFISGTACVGGFFFRKIIVIYVKGIWLMCFTAFLLFAADRLYGVIMNMTAKTSQSQTIVSGSSYEEDYLLGSKAGNNLNRHVISILHGDTLFDVTYHTDNLGRRITINDTSASSDNFLMFFGCSVTWGWGLDDSLTLPSQSVRACGRENAYNYAFPGYGPQHMLTMFESKNLREEISDPEGVAIYVFIPHHINRAIGDLMAFNRSGKSMPWYDYDDNGNLIRKGNFTNRKWKNKLFRILGCSHIVSGLKQNFPAELKMEHYELTAGIIAKSADLYKEQFSSSEFYVLLYPVRPIYRKMVQQMKMLLLERNIKVLDYSDFFGDNFNNFELDAMADQHPNEDALHLLSLQIAHDICGELP